MITVVANPRCKNAVETSESINNHVITSLKIILPPPKTATDRPIIVPFLCGNHYTSVAIGHT